MSSDPVLFHAADWAVFILALLAAGSVGVIQGILDLRKRKEETEKPGDDVGARNLSPWPASLSIMASVSAAPFVLGIPAEIYLFGTMFAMVFIAYAIAIPFMAHFFFDRWYSMNITSMYEYLEMRFNKTLRSAVTGIFAFTMLVYMGIIVYSPALAFSQVTGVNTSVCIVLVGTIGIVYTAVGGLKGVLWVDAIQMIIILASVLLIIIKGSIDVGGLGQVWSIAGDGGRLIFDDISGDLTVRHTYWTQTIGGFFFVSSSFANQAVVQKLLGLKSRRDMFVTSYISMVALVVYFLLFVLCGLVIYANYAGCSPLATGAVSTLDQIVPYFVLQSFEGIYGVSGLFTSAVFGASLSTMAAGTNAIAGLTLLDVALPVYKIKYNRAMAPSRAGLLFKGLVVFYGLLTMGVAFLAPLLGPSILQIGVSIVGTLAGPIFALFIMARFMPFVNTFGAITSLLGTLPFVLWLNLGAIITESNIIQAHPLPLRTDLCPLPNISNPTSGTTTWTNDLHPTTTAAHITVGSTGARTPNSSELSGLDYYYAISYVWYSLYGILIACTIGTLASLATGCRKGEPVDTSMTYACCYKNTTSDEDDMMPIDGKQRPSDISTLSDGTYFNQAYTHCVDNVAVPEIKSDFSTRF